MPKKARILVVDDDQSLRNTLSETLELEGFRVDNAENGKEAIKKSETNFYNIAIVDWRLPDIEGTKLLSLLKETTPKMVKILLTGYPSMNNAIDAINNDADAFIIKSADFKDLFKKVKELLRKQNEAMNYSEAAVANFIETRTRMILETKINNKSGTI